MQDGSTFPAPAGFTVVSSEQIRGGAGMRLVHPDPGLKVALAPAVPVAGSWYQFELQFPPEGVVDVQAEFTFTDGKVLWQRFPALARNHFLAHFRLEGALAGVTLFIAGSGRLAQPRCRFERVGLGGQLATAAWRGIDVFRRDGFGAVRSAVNYLWRLSRPGSIVVSRGSVAATGEAPYEAWIRTFDEAPERDRARHDERLAALTQRPLITVAAPAEARERIARALAGQIYPEWELLIAASTDAADLNALLAQARGSHLLQLPADATLRPHALLDLALAVEREPAAALIYADEDSIDAAGRRSDPRFKPAWSPHYFGAQDYLGALRLWRIEALCALGGWRAEESAHDFARRVTGAVAPDAIVHLAKVLTHRSHHADPLPRSHLRAGEAESMPRVSLIIPTRDRAELLEPCVRSIRARTRYPNYEILIVDNGSVEEKTARLFDELTKDKAVRVLPQPGPFNFSRLNNVAAREATGDMLALVNNDIEAIDDHWLDEMVSLAWQPEVGCVGAKLLYPDGRLQHAGIAIGLGGVAGHAHRFEPKNAPGYLGRLRTAHEVSAVTAACLLVRREVFDQVGGLDEELQVAFNDVDFCLKLRAAGYLNIWTPFAELIHHESVSRGRDFTPTKAKRFADEYATMQRRWGAVLLNDPYYSPHLTYDREDFSVRLR